MAARSRLPLIIAALSLAGCPEWPGRPPCPLPTCTTKASQGGFYLDPAAQGKKTRVWLLTHMLAADEGEQPHEVPPHEPGPDGEQPPAIHGDYVSAGGETYAPVHIGPHQDAAGGGARVLELAIKVNTPFTVIVTDDPELPVAIAKGDVTPERSAPPAGGISPTTFPLTPIDWWGSPQSSASHLWYTAEHVTGKVYLVRTGDPPEDDVYRAMGTVAALFVDDDLVGCHSRSYRFEKVR